MGEEEARRTGRQGLSLKTLMMRRERETKVNVNRSSGRYK